MKSRCMYNNSNNIDKIARKGGKVVHFLSNCAVHFKTAHQEQVLVLLYYMYYI